MLKYLNKILKVSACCPVGERGKMLQLPTQTSLMILHPLQKPWLRRWRFPRVWGEGRGGETTSLRCMGPLKTGAAWGPSVSTCSRRLSNPLSGDAIPQTIRYCQQMLYKRTRRFPRLLCTTHNTIRFVHNARIRLRRCPLYITHELC